MTKDTLDTTFTWLLLATRTGCNPSTLVRLA